MVYPGTEVRPEQPPSADRNGIGVAETAAGTRQHDPDRSPPVQRMTTAWRLNFLAALLIVTGGYVHFCLYRHGYRFIPKIGVGFLLQFTLSAVLAGALIVTRRQIRRVRRSVALGQLVRFSAIGLSVGTLAALGLAHTRGGLFQFHEIGLRPAPQSLIAIVAESVATLLLVIAMIEARSSGTRLNTVVAAAAPELSSLRDAA